MWQEGNNAINGCENLNDTPVGSISLDEGDVLCAIKKLKSGFDGLPAIFFKSLGSTLVVPLTVVFKQLLSVSYVPNVWKKTIITPVHNKKLSCRRETARCLMSLNISLSHLRSFEMAFFRKG